MIDLLCTILKHILATLEGLSPIIKEIIHNNSEILSLNSLSVIE